jgi:tRNA(fMet)-specific endonuclease VapC
VGKSDPVYLLDTNILTHPVKPRPVESVMTRIVKNRALISTSAISLEEGLYGFRRAGQRRGVDFLNDLVAAGLPVFAYRKETAVWTAEQRARLERAGNPLDRSPRGARDLMIASIAAINDLILVTDNLDDFAGLPVQTENWLSRRH